MIVGMIMKIIRIFLSGEFLHTFGTGHAFHEFLSCQVLDIIKHM